MPIARNGEIGISNDVHGEPAAPVLMLVPGIGEQIGGVQFPDEHVEVLTDVGFRVVRVDCRDFGLSTAIDAAGRPDFDGVLGAVVARAVPTVPYTYLDMARRPGGGG
jgi:pimeloyl-ACP methyl ester carboxylesterase